MGFFPYLPSVGLLDGWTYAAFHGLGPRDLKVVAGWNVPAPTSKS